MMLPRLTRSWATPILVALLFLGLTAPAAAINVQPVVIDLQSVGRRASAIITVQNTFAERVPMELTVHPVRIVNGTLQEIEGEVADDLLVFPSQVALEPNQSQAFRVQWLGDPELGASQHFFVTVSQLPVQLPNNQNTIQVLHQFKVLVSVGSAAASPDLEVVETHVGTNADGKPQPVLSVRNDGATYGYVGDSRMTVVQRDDAGTELFRKTFEPDEIRQVMGLGLIPSQQSRVLPINVELPQASGKISVELSPAESK